MDYEVLRKELKEINKYELIELHIALLKRIDRLEGELMELKRKLAIKKDSSNSSKPPSQDMGSPKKNQSLRKPSDKKSGGQPGHKGTNLKMTETPDEIIDHKPSFCNGCGHTLALGDATQTGRFQEVNIPPIQIKVSEHRYYSCTCSVCGQLTETKAPTTANIRYGNGVGSMIAYLSTRQYLPYQRMTELLSDMFGLKMSQGTVDNILDRFAKKASGIVDSIRSSLSGSEVVGSDETGIKVNGKQGAFWTWQDEQNTLIVPAKGRGYAAVEENMGNILEDCILIHDCWAAQLKTPAKNHQICLAHLLRDLKFLSEIDNGRWQRNIKAILERAIYLKDKILEWKPHRFQTERARIEKHLDRLLEQDMATTNREVNAFAKRLRKYRNYLFVFLYHENVPYHNNASEQAIRNAKVKQKVSGQFKSWTGAERFAAIRSVIDTCIKRKVNVMEALNLTAQVSC